jgi:hypothetical protein
MILLYDSIMVFSSSYYFTTSQLVKLYVFVATIICVGILGTLLYL